MFNKGIIFVILEIKKGKKDVIVIGFVLLIFCGIYKMLLNCYESVFFFLL